MNDQSSMPFGKHKGEPMEKVPASYLLWLWNKWQDQPSAPRDQAMANVRDYIIESMSALEKECPDVIVRNRPK